jgi:hypothetical protein
MAGSGRASALHTSPMSPRGSSSFDAANSVQNGLMLSTAVRTCPASVGITGGKLVGDRSGFQGLCHGRLVYTKRSAAATPAITIKPHYRAARCQILYAKPPL